MRELIAGGPRRWADAAAGAALVLMWSSGFIGADLGTRHAAADTLLAWRYLVAAGLLVALAAAVGDLPRWRGIGRDGVVGVLCQGLYLGGIVTGVSLGVPAGTAALVAALQPLVVAVLASALLGQRASPTVRVGLLLGLTGVTLVVAGDLRLGDAPAWAYGLPAAGMLGLSFGTVLDRRWAPAGSSLLQAMTAQTLVVAGLVVAEAAMTGRLTPPAHSGFWWAVAWVVGLSTFGGWGCYFLVLRRSGATHVSTLLYLTPPTTMVWATVMLGDRLGALSLLGTAVCAVAVVLVLRGPRAALTRNVRRASPTPQPVAGGKG